jgi:hypothetical protein
LYISQVSNFTSRTTVTLQLEITIEMLFPIAVMLFIGVGNDMILTVYSCQNIGIVKLECAHDRPEVDRNQFSHQTFLSNFLFTSNCTGGLPLPLVLENIRRRASQGSMYCDKYYC